MDEPEGVAAYLGGVATAHLGRMDDSFVRAALRLAKRGARVLDVGTGTAAIPVKMAEKRTDLTIVGIDLSEGMIRSARERVRRARMTRRVRIRRGGAGKIPFSRGTFDLVVSNSVLHHLPDPVPAFNEMARVLRPSGRVFIRDLRRPGPSRMMAHIRRHGRFYTGEMKRLFSDSVRAAFKVSEIRALLALSSLAGCRARPQFETYVVIEGSRRRKRRH